jgi:2-dehydropantoate 2-reductase
MKIAIIGSGGVGGYFGAKLAKAGYEVSFLARGQHLKAIKNNGLKIKSIEGNFEVNNLFATDKIKELGHPDLIIIGVKAWQIKEIKDKLKSIVHNHTSIIPLQNGVMAVDELSESIDKSNILGGLCRIISMIEKPGVINHLAITPTIVFGELNKKVTIRTKEIKAIFDNANIKCHISEDIESDLWKKFISICVGGLLAVSKTTYGELREIKETRQLMIELMKEIYNLSQKIGINIESDFIDKTVAFIDTFPYDSTASMTRDIWDGKPSELEYQNGTVVKLGEKYEFDTPINRFIYYSLLPSEIKARKQYNCLKI